MKINFVGPTLILMASGRKMQSRVCSEESENLPFLRQQQN